MKVVLDMLMSAQADAVCGAGFRSRPLDTESYPYLWADALAVRVREGGRVVKVECALATAVDSKGRRGLSGVKLVVSDSHTGLVSAIEAVLPGAV